MDFVAIDVETANADMASICQIGIAKFADGELVEEWSSLVNPEDYFNFINVGIHGITENDVNVGGEIELCAAELAERQQGGHRRLTFVYGAVERSRETGIRQVGELAKARGEWPAGEIAGGDAQQTAIFGQPDRRPVAVQRAP